MGIGDLLGTGFSSIGINIISDLRARETLTSDNYEYLRMHALRQQRQSSPDFGRIIEEIAKSNWDVLRRYEMRYDGFYKGCERFNREIERLSEEWISV